MALTNFIFNLSMVSAYFRRTLLSPIATIAPVTPWNLRSSRFEMFPRTSKLSTRQPRISRLESRKPTGSYLPAARIISRMTRPCPPAPIITIFSIVSNLHIRIFVLKGSKPFENSGNIGKECRRVTTDKG